LRPASAGDEVLIRLHQGAQKGDATNLGSLSEPRRKQNLYANPKRTAKFSNYILSDASAPKKFKQFSKNFSRFFHQPLSRPTAGLYTINRLVTN
jgi:hypothetical protein